MTTERVPLCPLCQHGIYLHVVDGRTPLGGCNYYTRPREDRKEDEWPVWYCNCVYHFDLEDG